MLIFYTDGAIDRSASATRGLTSTSLPSVARSLYADELANSVEEFVISRRSAEDIAFLILKVAA